MRPLLAARSASSMLMMLISAPLLAVAQAPSGSASPAPGACWRVQFATWVPALDWTRSGHAGDPRTVDRAVTRIRDSLFVRDSVAAHSSAMLWESTARGWTLMLYPSWWPAGVAVRFDSTSPGNAEMKGDAVALVGDGSRPESRARARVWQVPCN